MALDNPPSLQDFLPNAGPLVEQLGLSAFATRMQDFTAPIEIPHIVGLFMLAGVSIVVNLRLIGLGLRQVSPAELWRGLKIWFDIGLVMTLVSGLALGVTSALKLYSSVAFLVKVIALIAAAALTYFVSGPTALSGGEPSARVKAALTGSLVVWLVALSLFATQVGVNPGMIHLMTAAGLLGVLVLKGRPRFALVAGTLAIFVIWQLVTHVFILEGETQADLDRYMAANRLFMVLTGLWIFGALLLSVWGRTRTGEDSRFNRGVAYASILSWVTVAAAGRWIAFAS